MKKLLAVCCSLFALYAHASALVPLSTTTEFTSTAIARFRAYHGETVRLTHRLTLAGAPLDLSGASARFYWRTEEMTDWWSTEATLEADSVWCDFTPEMDPGTEAIWYFFGITQANAIAYRANGSLTLLDSPGFTPADLGEPDTLAAALEALFKEADTRYTTKAEHATLATQVQGKADANHTHADLQQSATVLLQAINSEAESREEADAALEALVAGKADASHTHTIAQVSNLQTQLNAKAATSTVSALTTRVSSLETEALRLEDAKADALTREASVNNVGSLDPMSDASMATADQMNGLSYQKTTLGAMGFAGAAVKITHFTTFRRSGSTENGDSNMWLRILRHNGTAWTVAYQASVYVTHNSYNLNGMRIEHTMVHKAGTQFIPTDEPVIFCYATSESAPASSFINFGMKVVPASPNMLASGQSSLPAVNATPGWAHGLAFDARYEQQVALSEALDGKSDAFTVGEGLTLEAGVLSANAPKITVDSTLSSTSTNPVQNKVVYSALNGKVDKSSFDSFKDHFNANDREKPYVKSYGYSMHTLKTIFDSNNEADNWAEKFDNAKITFEWWHQYSGVKEDSFDVPISAFKALANGGGGHTEVWKGNVGFGEQDTFFGPRRVAEGEGQFYKGYPRLHNHGQDIHEVSGFSRDSRDDETVWSHRLLLPWDLAKANDTSYLMAAVQWESTRLGGVNCKFVQPLLSENTDAAKTYLNLPYALPCFENSPIYWNGHLIYGEGSAVKQIQMPWDKIADGATAKLALEGSGGGGSNLTMERNDSTKEISIYDGSSDSYIGVFRVAQDGTFTSSYKDTRYNFSFVTQALLDRITALETAEPVTPAPTLEVATWSGTVCSVPWGANPLLIDCSGQTEHDFTIQFPVADWPEGAARLLFIRATPTPTVGDGIIDSLKGGNGLLTPSVVGYDYLEQGEEHTVSAWRRGARLRLMVVDRERLSDL